MLQRRRQEACTQVRDIDPAHSPRKSLRKLRMAPEALVCRLDQMGATWVTLSLSRCREHRELLHMANHLSHPRLQGSMLSGGRYRRRSLGAPGSLGRWSEGLEEDPVVVECAEAIDQGLRVIGTELNQNHDLIRRAVPAATDAGEVRAP